jgi:hypothetical protein
VLHRGPAKIASGKCLSYGMSLPLAVSVSLEPWLASLGKSLRCIGKVGVEVGFIYLLAAEN